MTNGPALTVEAPEDIPMPMLSGNGPLTPMSAALMAASANFGDDGFFADSSPLVSPKALGGSSDSSDSPPLASPKPLPGKTPVAKAPLTPHNMNALPNSGVSLVTPPPSKRKPQASNEVSQSMPSKMWDSVKTPGAAPKSTAAAPAPTSALAAGDNIKVVVRVRPLSDAEKDFGGGTSCVHLTAKESLQVSTPDTNYQFAYDCVAGPETSQGAMFDVAGRAIVENCLNGYNSCLFAYGQTGSGKTHTMLGEMPEALGERPDGRGVIPRVFEHLFSRMQELGRAAEEEGHNLEFLCRCSFLEIYNENIADLLGEEEAHLQIREDLKHGVFVENLTESTVTTPEETAAVLLRGAAARRVAETNMNRESSRSHSVFTCVIESKSVEASGLTNIRHSRLNLVDLAGSERQRASGAQGERLKEASSINKSLSSLGHVIMCLVDISHGKARHVPYRDSRLTFLLQDSLGGNAKTIMIANVSPAATNAQETVSTLKFAQRAKFIRNKAVVNEDTSGDVDILKQQIAHLKREMHMMARSAPPRSPLPSTPWVPAGSHSPRTPVSAASVRGLEKALAGALRREAVAQGSARRLQEQVDKMEALAKQRESEVRQERMVVKFRDERIKRLEAALAGQGLLDASSEASALTSELELLREKLEQHPEVTRFAAENLRLTEQLKAAIEKNGEAGYNRLADEMATLREQLESLLTEKEEKGTPARLAAEREEAVGEAARVAAKLEAAEAERAQERERLTGRAEAFEKVAEEKVSKVEQLSGDLAREAAAREQLAAEVAMAREALEKATARDTEATEQIQALQAELSALHAQAAGQAVAADAAETARVKAEADAAHFASELEALKAQAEEEAADLRRSSSSLDVQLAAASSELASLRVSSSSMGSLLEEAQGVAAGLREDVARLASEHAATKAARDKVAAELAAALDSLQGAEALRLSNEGFADELKKSRDDTEARLAAAAAEAEAAAARAAASSEELAAAKQEAAAEAAAAAAALAAAKEEAAEAQATLAEEKEKLEELEEEFEVALGWRGKAEERHKEIKRLTAELEAAAAQAGSAAAAEEAAAAADAAASAARAEVEAKLVASEEAAAAARAKLETKLAAAEAALAEGAAKLAATEEAANTGLEEVEAQLAAASAALAAKDTALAAAAEARAAQESELAASREAVAQAAGTLGDAAAGSAALQAELAAARAAATVAAGDLEALQEEAAALRARLQEMEGLLEGRDRDLVAARREGMAREEAAGEERERLLAASQGEASSASQAQQKLEELLAEREEWLREMHENRTEASAAREASHELRSKVEAQEVAVAAAEGARATAETKVEELEEEVAKLAGQQNLNQRIQHHAKIKDENSLLRKELEKIKEKMTKQTTYHERAMEDLARYRAAAGQSEDLDIDEEARLRGLVEAAECEAAGLLRQFTEVAQGLAALSSRAGDLVAPSPAPKGAAAAALAASPPPSEGRVHSNPHPAATEALRALSSRMARVERELEDRRSQVRLLEERERLISIRKAVGGGTPMGTPIAGTPSGRLQGTTSLPFTPIN